MKTEGNSFSFGHSTREERAEWETEKEREIEELIEKAKEEFKRYNLSLKVLFCDF